MLSPSLHAYNIVTVYTFLFKEHCTSMLRCVCGVCGTQTGMEELFMFVSECCEGQT